MEVQFEDLDKSDLFIDCIYKGGKVPNMSSEPFHKLIPGCENTGVMKDGIIYSVKNVPSYDGKQITLGEIMDEGDVDEKYFIPENRLYYTSPDVDHSDETHQRLSKEERQK